MLTGSSNAEIGIGLICACLPAVSAYYARGKKGAGSYGHSSRNAQGTDARGEIVMTRTFHVQTTQKDAGLEGDSHSNLGGDEVVLISNVQASPQSKTVSWRGSESL